MTTFAAVCACNTWFLFFPEKMEVLIEELNAECIAEFGHPILERIDPE